MNKAIQDRVYKDVEFLTEIRPFRTYINTETLSRVCDYISEEFRSAGFETSEQKWIADGREYKNIIASYQKEKKKRLIIGAHYDVCGDQPGADDNASAVGGLLETARLFMQNQPDIDYRVDFVAYCLEEPPFYATDKMGSYIHAKSLFDNKVDVMGMLCYEMIGFFSDEPNSQSFPHPALAAIYPHTANFIVVVGIEKYKEFNNRVFQYMNKDSGVNVEQINFPDPEGLAGMSDQRNYWKFGYQALMINDTSFIRNPNYHQITDTIDTLDFEKMTEVINSTYNAAVNLD